MILYVYNQIVGNVQFIFNAKLQILVNCLSSGLYGDAGKPTWVYSNTQRFLRLRISFYVIDLCLS